MESNKYGPKVKCRVCEDVIFSTYSGEFVRCKCGAIFCDQTEHYSRYGGEPRDYIFLDEKENNNDVPE